MPCETRNKKIGKGPCPSCKAKREKIVTTYDPEHPIIYEGNKLDTIVNYLADQNTKQFTYNIFKVKGQYEAIEISHKCNPKYKSIGTLGGQGILYTREQLRELILNMTSKKGRGKQ